MRKSYNPTAEVPLEGVRVLDLSRLVSGNILTHVLADLGAEVVKVERPKVGDDLRTWGVNGIQTYWKIYARNKKSLTLDLRSKQGQEILLRLAEGFHVLVENFVPGTLERWGIGPDILQGRNPNLVVIRVSGWGQTGPFRDKPGFGSLVEAMSGFASINGFEDRPPVLPPLALADIVAGLYGAVAALTALRAREVGGRAGQIIDLALFEPIFAILGPQAANYTITGEVPKRMGSSTNITAPRNVYRCSDGKYVALSASMQAMAERLFRSIGRPDLIDDPRFRTNADRVANNGELDSIVAEFMAAHTQEENLRTFEEATVTVGPVCDISQLMDHPYIRGREVLVNYPDSDMGELPMHNVIPRLSETPGAIRSPAPELGQHNCELLGEIGYTEQDVERLTKTGII
jgi:crotonobetainyl-CoA:carnitine CoA-transferase CaiB-like acyl-CoA transferase